MQPVVANGQVLLYNTKLTKSADLSEISCDGVLIMSNFMTNLEDSLRLIFSMGWSDVLDVLIVAAAVYAVISFIRRTNAVRFAQGILLLLLALGVSSMLHLTVTSFLLRQVFEIGVLAVIVLFQPEIRRALERVGSYKLFSFLGRDAGGPFMEKTIRQTVYACEDMSKSRTGALIVFERNNRLNEPMASAGCMLPLSENANLSRDLGMRHRAGIGMSERSDALVVIVSEETGGISVAQDGLLKRHLTRDTFEDLLQRELLPAEEPGGGKLKGLFNRTKGKENAQ